MDAAVSPPKLEPGVEMREFEFERDMFERHRALIAARAPGGGAPEIADSFEMSRPVENMTVENRTDQLMLSHIGIKMMEKEHQSAPASEPVKKRFFLKR